MRLARKLTDGATLCAEFSNDPDYPDELYVFLEYPNGIQRDLVCVQQNYIYPKDEDGIRYLPNEIKVLLTRSGSPDYLDDRIIHLEDERKDIDAWDGDGAKASKPLLTDDERRYISALVQPFADKVYAVCREDDNRLNVYWQDDTGYCGTTEIPHCRYPFAGLEQSKWYADAELNALNIEGVHVKDDNAEGGKD